MLDALKFAFEILVVGALALPWLAILSRMFASGPGSSLPSYLSVFTKARQGHRRCGGCDCVRVCYGIGRFTRFP
jgi:hypothetical protein